MQKIAPHSKSEIYFQIWFSPRFGGKNGGVLSMRMQVILDSSFARPGSAPIRGGKKGEFRDWTKNNHVLIMWFRIMACFLSWTGETVGYNRHVFRTPKMPSCETQTLEVRNTWWCLNTGIRSWEMREPFSTPGSGSNGSGFVYMSRARHWVVFLSKRGQDTF